MAESQLCPGKEEQNLFIMHWNSSPIQKWEIERVIKKSGIQMEYFVFQKENVDYGKVVLSEIYASQAKKEFRRFKFYVRLWEDSDELYEGVVKLSSAKRLGKVRGIKKAATQSVTGIKKAKSDASPEKHVSKVTVSDQSSPNSAAASKISRATEVSSDSSATASKVSQTRGTPAKKISSTSTNNPTSSKKARSKVGERIDTCLLVKYRHQSEVITEKCIEDLLKGYVGIQAISVYHNGCQYYGHVKCVSKDHAKAIIMKVPNSTFEICYQKTTDKIGTRVMSSPSQTNQEPSNSDFSTSSQNTSTPLTAKDSDPTSTQGPASSIVAPDISGYQEPTSHLNGIEKTVMPGMKATNNRSQESFSGSLSEQKSSNKLISNCKLVEVTTVEEPFPCSKELMAYFLYKFNEMDFKSLWKSIEPVQVYCKRQELYVRGTAHEVQAAKSKVLEHHLIQGLFLELIPDLRKDIPEKICKRISANFNKTVLLYEVNSSREPLLCSKNFSELKEAKAFLMSLVPQTKIYNIKAGTQFDIRKLNAVIRSLKTDYCIDVTSSSSVAISGLCEEDVEYGWHQVQMCYKEITEIVFVTNFQFSQFHKKFTVKANSLSCQIDVTKVPQKLNDCVPLTVKGYTKKDVSETAAFISSKCLIKEEVTFKDISAADVVTSSQFSKWSDRAQSKNIHLSKMKNSCGFLLEGNPKPVKEMIMSLLQSYHSTLENAAYISFGQVVLRSFHRPLCTTETVSEWKECLKSKFMSDMTLSLLSNSHSKDGDSFEEFLRVSQDHVVTVKIVMGRLSKEETDAIVVPTDSVKNDKRYPIQLTCLQAESFQDGCRACLYGFQTLTKVGSTEMLDSGELPCLRILHVVYPLANLFPLKLPESDFVSKSLSFASTKRIGSISFPDIDPQVMVLVINALTSLHSPTIHTVRIVVGNKHRAKLYADVLKQVVDLSPRLSSTHQTNLASFKKYQWSWKDDRGVFVSYDPVATDILNEAYDKNPAGACALRILHQHYKVDFRTMKQCNISSLHEREVFRSSPKVQISQESVTWKYLDDSGRFSAYLPGDAAQIEAMYQKKVDSDYMMILSRMYSFDFDKMLQVNAETGYSRNIKRELIATSSSDQNEASFQSGFLHENEVIINFKCPAQYFQNVKTYIHDRIEEKLSCEDINLPVSSLPDHLEGIIKKHSMMVSCELTTAGPTQGKRTVLRVKGSEACVQKAQTEIQKAIIDSLSPNVLVHPPLKAIQYPHTWEPMTEEEQCRIVQLNYMSDEYGDVSTSFMDTMPDYEVVDIQRVQNKWIWERYAMTKRRMSEKNNGRVNELELFHGSRTAPSVSICKSEEGFDMRFSREGLWGQANYFAKNASYSDDYAYYKDYRGKNKEMMLAQVLTGDTYECKPDKTLRMPPEKSSSGSDKKLIQRYDSVCGMTNNCKVYMTYCNENAYPAYIITYSASGSCTTDAWNRSSHVPPVTTGARSSSNRKTHYVSTVKPSHTTQVPPQQASSTQVSQLPTTTLSQTNLLPSQQQPSFQTPYQQPSVASQMPNASWGQSPLSSSNLNQPSNQPASQQYLSNLTPRQSSASQKVPIQNKPAHNPNRTKPSSCIIS